MNILSLFDWISCWMLALQRAWIRVNEYFASEIDKYAIQVSEKNFPKIKRLWDITKINYNNWQFAFDDVRHTDIVNIDILLWGSPCQWFSFAGKQLNFEDPRSKLFFDYVRILKEVKPKYFLLENVRMKKEYQDIISENLFWVQPIMINSSLLSAQNRRRLYRVWKRQGDWTYKQVHINQPEDKWILLNDVLLDDVEDKYYMTIEQFKKLKFESLQRLYNKKASTLNTSQGWHRQPKILVNYFNQRVLLEKCWTLWTNYWFTNKQGYQIIEWEHKIRKLTPIEYERLQTVPDNYTDCVSNSQRYKCLWNWWTVDVITHIFNSIID